MGKKFGLYRLFLVWITSFILTDSFYLTPSFSAKRKNIQIQSARTEQQHQNRQHLRHEFRIAKTTTVIPSHPWSTQSRSWVLHSKSENNSNDNYHDDDTSSNSMSSKDTLDSPKNGKVKSSIYNNFQTSTEEDDSSSILLDTISMDMPWSQLQDWALRDQLPRYTVVIPIEDNKKKGSTKHKMYILWRTMTKEVVELAGYPVDFLQDRHEDQVKRNTTNVLSTGDVLPFLDEYEFESSGGLSGRVYGVRGVADGTVITTTPVGNVQLTVPKGFVLTQDGSVAYELGTPVQEQFSLDGTTKKIRPSMVKAGQTVGELGKNGLAMIEEDADGMLMRLGGSTAILLGGALAIDMLSHHLTVNVFWV